MAKAIRMFGNLEHVSQATRLIATADADRIEAAIDADLQPCSRDQASTLVAELLGAYPGLVASKDGSTESYREFQLYAVKLCEAFKEFSYSVGKAIVHGGTGIPAKVAYKPQPSDVVKFGAIERDKRINVKTMVQRHRAEAIRRAEEAEEEQKYSRGDPADRAARVKAAVAGFKNNIPPDPILAIMPRPKFTDRHGQEYKSDLDMDALIASHDAAMAGAHRRKSAA